MAQGIKTRCFPCQPEVILKPISYNEAAGLKHHSFPSLYYVFFYSLNVFFTSKCMNTFISHCVYYNSNSTGQSHMFLAKRKKTNKRTFLSRQQKCNLLATSEQCRIQRLPIICCSKEQCMFVHTHTHAAEGANVKPKFAYQKKKLDIHCKI